MNPFVLIASALLLLTAPSLLLAHLGPASTRHNDFASNTSTLKFSHAENKNPTIKLADEEDIRANMPRILQHNSDFARAFTSRFPSPRDMALFLADVAKRPKSGLSSKCAVHVIDGFMALERWETWALRSEYHELFCLPFCVYGAYSVILSPFLCLGCISRHSVSLSVFRVHIPSFCLPFCLYGAYFAILSPFLSLRCIFHHSVSVSVFTVHIPSFCFPLCGYGAYSVI